MLDDLRNSSSFIEEEEEPEVEQQPVLRRRPAARRQNSTFLGMTAPQRFLLSLVLFFMVLVLGVAALVATGSLFISF